MLSQMHSCIKKIKPPNNYKADVSVKSASILWKHQAYRPPNFRSNVGVKHHPVKSHNVKVHMWNKYDLNSHYTLTVLALHGYWSLHKNHISWVTSLTLWSGGDITWPRVKADCQWKGRKKEHHCKLLLCKVWRLKVRGHSVEADHLPLQLQLK